MERDLKVLPKRVPRKECRERSSQVSMETFNSRTTKYSKTKNELKIYIVEKDLKIQSMWNGDI